MKKAFIDTLFVVVLISPRDQYHTQAIELSNRFDGQSMLVTDAVLLEIGNALSRNYKSEASEAIEFFLASSEIEVVHLSPDLFDKGFALYRAYRDKARGLVDCISFVVMREASVTDALTFDRHFEQAGFLVLMHEDVNK